MPEKKQPLQLHIICHNPPPATFKGLPASVFGLQDKKGAVDSGQPQSDGSLLFSCTVEAKHSDDRLDFSGAYVQGTKDTRFLYLSWASDVGGWVQRIKISLMTITHEQATSGKPLQAVIENGSASGTVKPKDSWKMV